MTCAVCEVNAADSEAVFFPTRVDVLFPLMMRHADDLEAWPSIPICDPCAEITAPLFHALAEGLSVAAVVALTSDDLLLLCRLGLAREGAT